MVMLAFILASAAGQGPALFLLGQADPTGSPLSILNLIANTGAVGLLAILVIWVGPKLFRDWTDAHRQVGQDVKASLGAMISEQQRREDSSRANILTFIQREKDSFDRREERMYQVIEKGLAATHQALNNMAEAERSQSNTLAGLQEAIRLLAKAQEPGQRHQA